jgi:hypothetical protein
MAQEVLAEVPTIKFHENLFSILSCFMHVDRE